MLQNGDSCSGVWREVTIDTEFDRRKRRKSVGLVYSFGNGSAARF